MAHFKISLIVPNNDAVSNDQTETYLSHVITDYTDQQSEWQNNHNRNNILKRHTVAYTYNEKLAMHKNGQQELTFNMDDKVCIDEEWIENPFARILRTGVQIELQDKFHNRKLFTVNKIQYNFNNVSITYQVSCQDSFTYQLNRQNNGYTLVNDETSIDFLGALTADQWAEIITKDCYITYQYLPLWRGLYQDNYGVLHIYHAPGEKVENPVYLGVNTENVNKIIKPVYDTKTYKDFYESFPFSISGASANAALISIAETLGLQVNVVEGLAAFDPQNPGAPLQYSRYFFFGPTKNPDVTGLTYSPLRDIQNFGLNFSGDSLTTVLNVKSTTWNNEEIGIFPTIPSFFNALFMSNDWTKTTYYNGFFMEAVKGQNYGYTFKDSIDLTYFQFKRDDQYKYYYLIDDNSSDSDGITINGVRYWKARIKNVLWPNYYNKICFYWEDQKNITSFTTGPSVITINSLQTNDAICFAYIDDDNTQIFQQNEVITKQVIWTVNNDTNNHWFLLIKRPNTSADSNKLILNTLFFTITRDYTDEEVKFATIAESCPWLENKIMDFSYFVRQGILSKYEYEGLMDWLLNGLRIINGQLMCLADAYYHALHERTEILSKIETDTDALGAIFYADVIEPYTKTGMIGSNISNFINTYHQLFESDNNNKENGLLSINEIISDRFNKFFSAEQRFLQHMYNFRKYFEDRNIFSAGAVSYLDDVSYAVNKAQNVPNNYLISFDGAIKWEPLTSNSEIIHHHESDYSDAFTISPIFTYSNGKYIEQKIPNLFTYKEFYIPNIIAGNLNAIDSTHTYNPAHLYYLTYAKYVDFFGQPLKEKIITLTDEEEHEQSYVRLSRQEVIKVFLSQNYSSHDYYIRDTNLKVPFDWVRTNYDVINNRLAFHSWPAVSVLKELNPNLGIGDEQEAAIAKQFGKTTAWELYKSMSPIEELYIYDYSIAYTTKQEDDQLIYNFKVLDEKGTPYEYDDGHYYHTIKHAGDGSEDREEVQFTNLYRRFYAVPFLSYAQNTSSILSNNQNDTSASFSVVRFYNDVMAATKNSKYFVHYEDYTAKGWAIAGGILFSLLSYTIIPGAGLLCHIGGIVGAVVGGCHKYAYWGKKDDTTFEMSHYTGSDWTGIDYNDTRKQEQKLGASSDHLKGDSHWVNYTQKEDSELTIRGLTITWWNNPDQWYARIDKSHQSNYKHYFNYYQNIVATYSQGSVSHDQSGWETSDALDSYTDLHYDRWYFNDTTERILTSENRRDVGNDLLNYNYDYYWIKNRYGRFCKKTDGINYKDTYVWVPADFLKENVEIGTDIPERFGAIKFYPLVELREEINFLGVFTKEELNNNPTWIDYLNKLIESSTYDISFDSGDYVKLHIIKDDIDIIYYAVHLEPFEKLKISTTTRTLGRHDPNLFTINWKDADGHIYHYDTDCELKNSEIILNPVLDENDNDCLFFISETDDSLIKVEDIVDNDFNWTDLNLHWYSKSSIDSRTYTIAQILDDQSDYSYYYMSNTTLKAAEFRDGNTTITPEKFKLHLRTYSIDENEKLIIDDNIADNERSLTFNTAGDDSQSFEWMGYNFTITRHVVDSYNIGSMSNGTFWYHFHNRLDLPLIAEKAMIIETQLTTEWMQAYTASHYCQWFIPEYWQINASTGNNAWFSSIWQVNQDGSTNLSSLLVPEVEIYKYNNKTTLDGILFHYHPDINEQCDKEEYEVAQVDILKDNSAVLDSIQYIFTEAQDINLGKLTVQKYATRTYYYRVGGGTEHKNLIRTLDSKQKIYKYYNGLYAMQLYLLLNKYRNVEAPAYEQKLNEKLEWWKKLYTRYPGIFLENIYENADARTSQQLLQMAQLAFKDYSSPEKNYNITIIDAASLNGYEGQELHIGDGILLNTSDYYDAIDETYRALNQYLFISDISYNLRQDTDISLTVNSIKYQDKLLQSIVKLIR